MLDTIVDVPRKLAFAPTPSLGRKLQVLGEQVRLARQRRSLTMAMVAERAGMTRATLHKIERGDPTVTMGAYANVLFALGLSDDLTLLARDDALGRALQDAALGPRVVRPRSTRAAAPQPPPATP